MTFYEHLKQRMHSNFIAVIIMTHCSLVVNAILKRLRGELLPLCSQTEMIGSLIGGMIALVIISTFQVYVERKYPYKD